MSRAPRRLSAWWRWHRRRLLQLWGAGIAASVLVSLASAFGYLEAKRATNLDILMHLRGRQPTSKVVIVAVDDQAFHSLGQRQPLPRDYLAKVVQGLQRSGAAVVGLDIKLSSATAPEADAALAKAITEFAEGGVSRVIVPCTEPLNSGPLADPAFLDAVICGRIELAEEEDGVVRRARLLPRAGEQVEPSFALAVAARLSSVDQRALALAPKNSPVLLPLPTPNPDGTWSARSREPLRLRAGELVPINFVGPAGSIPTFPSDVVARIGDTGEVAAENPFREKVVLVGGTFEESRDFFKTAHGRIAGVEIHGNIIQMLLSRTFIQPSGWMVGLVMQVVVTLAIGLILVVARPWVGTLVCIATPFVVGIPVSYLIFHQGGFWVDFVLPMAAVGFMRKGANALERRRVRDVFGRCLSPDMAARVQAQAPDLAGEQREVTILFAGLHEVEALASTLNPEQVSSHLNQCFHAMTAAIFQHRGMVYDILGDGITAVFGAPLADADHALHAMQAASSMEQGLRQLQDRQHTAKLPMLGWGVGIHTSRVFASYIGGHAPLRYSIFGDEVKLAGLVEKLTKDLGTAILLTDETWRLLDGRAEVRDCGEVLVAGWSKPLRMFALETRNTGGSS